MIYTVTFNPSLDYIVSVENFQLGLTNRTSSEMLLPGGKGINVSTVLMNLGASHRMAVPKKKTMTAVLQRLVIVPTKRLKIL